jgi:hypothetical protein
MAAWGRVLHHLAEAGFLIFLKNNLTYINLLVVTTSGLIEVKGKCTGQTESP